MNALHEQFIAESRELIHQATGDLIAAEKDGFSPDRIDHVFRADLMLQALGFNIVLFAAASFAFVRLLESARKHGTLLQTGE